MFLMIISFIFIGCFILLQIQINDIYKTLEIQLDLDKHILEFFERKEKDIKNKVQKWKNKVQKLHFKYISEAKNGE